MHSIAQKSGAITRIRPKMKSTDKPISTPADVTGIILPHSWDKNGGVIEIAIYTNAEEVYRVVPNSLAHEITMNFMHKRIVVQGQIDQNRDGNMTIAIKEFSVPEEIGDDGKKGTERRKL